MALDLKTPGVHREESFVRTPAGLPTGVPGFVGFGQTLSGKPEVWYHVDQLAERWVPPTVGRSYLADAVAGFFANGGLRCYVVGAGNPDPDTTKAALSEASLTKALGQLGTLQEVDLLAVPDAMTLPASNAQRVQQAVLDQCTRLGNRFAILDAPLVSETKTDPLDVLKAWRDAVTKVVAPADPVNPANAGLYFPWIWTSGAEAPVPPCGHVAGIFARSDTRAGVFKAPANEELVGVVDLDYFVDDQIQGDLNPQGINCLRALPGRGLRVYGARTLNTTDPQWRYVSVRRLFLTLARWIDQNLAWAAFEPNTPRLWIRIQRELNTYLTGLWRANALKGATAGEAFFVKCDAETNPQEAREQGQVVTEIGLAPILPAEFVVVHVTHRAGAIQFS